MLARYVVMALQGVSILAALAFALIWLALVAVIISSLIRVWRRSESADPFERLAYMRSAQSGDMLQFADLGRRLLRYSFGCIVVAAIAAVAAGICATMFHVP